MAKRKGLLAFLVGAAAGAAALFLSDKDNREKTARAAKVVAKKAGTAKRQAISKTKKVVRKSKASARKAVRNVRKTVKRA
ncbi:MAG TPA: hypothetical protein VGA89_02820 [Patescibacteria group bacterium]|jgi:hypothetical protein